MIWYVCGTSKWVSNPRKHDVVNCKGRCERDVHKRAKSGDDLSNDFVHWAWPHLLHQSPLVNSGQLTRLPQLQSKSSHRQSAVKALDVHTAVVKDVYPESDVQKYAVIGASKVMFMMNKWIIHMINNNFFYLQREAGLHGCLRALTDESRSLPLLYSQCSTWFL